MFFFRVFESSGLFPYAAWGQESERHRIQQVQAEHSRVEEAAAEVGPSLRRQRQGAEPGSLGGAQMRGEGLVERMGDWGMRKFGGATSLFFCHKVHLFYAIINVGEREK